MANEPSPDDTTPVEYSGEYSTITLRSAWGSLSLLFFLAAVGARQIVRLLPSSLQGWNVMPPLAVILVPPLALLGLLAGLVGLRRGGRILATLGALLNAIVLVATLVFLLGFWWVRLR